MGAMKRIADGKRDARQEKNGKGKSGGKLLGRLNHTDGPATSDPFDWGNVSPSLISWLVGFCVANGGAVLFGCTRDGGAGTIKIYDGDASHTEYIKPQADVSMAVWSFCLQLAGEEETPPEPE